MSVEIHVPNKAYDGIIAGVQFHRGVGHFTDVVKAKNIADEFGFTVVGEKAVVEAKPKPTPKPRKPKVKVGE